MIFVYVSKCVFEPRYIFEPQSNLLIFNCPLPVIYGKDVIFEPFFFAGVFFSPVCSKIFVLGWMRV